MTNASAVPLTIDVSWDEEAQVWIAECREWPLFTEAGSLDGIRAKVPLMAADLLRETGQGPFDFDISLVVRFGESVHVAA